MAAATIAVAMLTPMVTPMRAMRILIILIPTPTLALTSALTSVGGNQVASHAAAECYAWP
jgi:hypothetical protein